MESDLSLGKVILKSFMAGWLVCYVNFIIKFNSYRRTDIPLRLNRILPSLLLIRNQYIIKLYANQIYPTL